MKLDLKKILLMIFFVFFFIILSIYINEIPFGIFCDEVAIGLRALELTQGNFSNFINPFFYKHFNYINGALPIYSNLPFILLFGINEFSIRLSSAFFSILSLITVFLILEKLKFKIPLFPIILIMLFSPIYFHLSRINFGHFPSLFFMLLGYLFYKSNRHILSGFSFGLSIYGYSGYVLTVPLFIFFLLIEQFYIYRFNFNKYVNFTKLFLAFFVIIIPLFLILKNPIYLQRLRDKDSSKNMSFINYSIKIVKNYSKYYSFDYLFYKGEIGMPNSFITRHSVGGSGELTKISIFLIIAAIFFYFFERRKALLLPFFLMAIFYPLPDILTSSLNNPPYSFSLFSSFICLPFLVAYGYQKIYFIFRRFNKQKLFNVVIFMLITFETVFFLNNYFNKYILYSSDYWGWQSGPREIIEYFKRESKNYHELYMTSYFNEPEVFINFYDPYNKYKNFMIGGLDMYNPNKKQLFAIRVEEYDNKENNFNIKKIIYFPNGKEGYYIGVLERN